MLKTKSDGQLIVISGPSGVGKGTICENLLKIRSNTWLSVSTTTREIRANEVEGINYYYISKEEFESKISNNEFLEYACVFGNKYYGTPKEKVNDHLKNGIDVILEIDIIGALQIKETFKDGIFVFILPPNMSQLKKRLLERGTESEEKVLERFKRAYKEINEISKYNYVVVNNDLHDAVNKVNSIIEAEKCRVDRIEEVYLNTVEEDIHEELIENN